MEIENGIRTSDDDKNRDQKKGRRKSVCGETGEDAEREREREREKRTKRKVMMIKSARKQTTERNETERPVLFFSSFFFVFNQKYEN